MIIGGITLFRKRRRPSSPEVISKNVEILQSFVETCDRRLMLRTEINSLEELLDGKRIGKKDYNRRKRILAQRVQALNKAFKKLANGVRAEGSQYKSFVERIERSEKEITSINGEINRLRNQFRSRKISKNNYRKTRRNYNRRLERATAELEGIIIELKEETR
jgi:chromosome segregation ATPase